MSDEEEVVSDEEEVSDGEEVSDEEEVGRRGSEEKEEEMTGPGG